MMTQTAARIVELQLALNAGHGDSHALQAEQRALWSRDFEGVSFDKIAAVAASWSFRRPELRDSPPRRVAAPPA